MPSVQPAAALASSALPPLRLSAQPQQLTERGPHDTLVQHSPYGPSRNATYGWGSLFAPPLSAAVPGHPEVHIGISSLNGVPTVGKSDRSMRSLLARYRKKFNCLEHCYPYHKVGDADAWTAWAEMVRSSTCSGGDAAVSATTAATTPVCSSPPFVYTIKANNLLTHVKQLQVDDAEVVAHVQVFFHERCPLLGPLLGPVLVQLPPSFSYSAVNLQRLTGLHGLLLGGGADAEGEERPRSSPAPPRRPHRIAVEFRHRSWYRDETFALLRSLRWALVVAHHHDDPTYSQVVDTGAGFLYVRLHGPLGRNVGDYGPLAMQLWAEEMLLYLRPPAKDPVGGGAPSTTADTTGREVFVFLNNSDSNVGGTTSSVVDATCLAEHMRRLLRPPPPEMPRSSSTNADVLPITAPEAGAAVPAPTDQRRRSPSATAATPSPKRPRTSSQGSGAREDEVVID